MGYTHEALCEDGPKTHLSRIVPSHVGDMSLYAYKALECVLDPGVYIFNGRNWLNDFIKTVFLVKKLLGFPMFRMLVSNELRRVAGVKYKYGIANNMKDFGNFLY